MVLEKLKVNKHKPYKIQIKQLPWLVAIKEPRDPRLYSLLPLWHRNTKKAKKRGEMLSHPSVVTKPKRGGALACIIITRIIITRIIITRIIISIISSRSGSTSSPSRKSTMSVHGEVEVLEHLIGKKRHLPLRCYHRLHLRSRRRNRVVP
jgi:hypothetical protein